MKKQTWKRLPAPKMAAAGLAAVLMLILSVPGQAAPKKHWYTDAKWWAGTAVILGVSALDVQSSCRAFAEGYHEENFVIRGSQSCGQVSGFGFSFAALSVGLHAMAWHCQQDDFWTKRAAGEKGRCYGENQYEGKHPKLNALLVYGAIPAIQAGVHIAAAVHNYELPRL